MWVESSIRLVEGLWYGKLLHNVLILLLMSLCSSTSLQAQIFTDDFEDGRFDQGALMWDGLNENGQKVPIGRYIAYIEASDAAGRSVQRHKTTVVVAR